MSDKRYTLVIPQELYDEVEKLAKDEGVTVIEILRLYIRLGLLASKGEVKLQSKDGNEVVLL